MSINKQSANLRFGVFVESFFKGSLSQDKAITTSIQVGWSSDMDAAPGTTLIFSSMVGGSPKADSYNLLGFFGAFAESELSITVSGGMAKGPLVLGSDRELSPVTYENLNDLVLLYEGGKLTKVYAETGTEVSLTYDLNGRLVRVENTRTGTTKDMEYADGVLSKVVSKKAHS